MALSVTNKYKTVKNLILFLSILFTLTINAQENKYDLYNCTGTKYKITSEGKWSEVTEISMIIRHCITERRIEFNNNANTVFYMSYVISAQKDLVDADGDTYTSTRWKGYDQEGKKCNLVVIDWPNLLNRNFVLIYSDVEIVFLCKLIVKPTGTQI